MYKMHIIYTDTCTQAPAHQNQPTSFKGQRRNVLALTGHKHTGGRPGLLRVGADSRRTDRGSTTTVNALCIHVAGGLYLEIWGWDSDRVMHFQVLFILAVVCMRARLVDLSPG